MSARRLPLALLTGALLFVPFGPLRWFPLGWVALTPLLIALRGQTARQRLKWGFTAGLVGHTLLNYWIGVTVYNALPLFGFTRWLSGLLAMGAWMGMAAVLGASVALFALLTDGAPRMGQRVNGSAASLRVYPLTHLPICRCMAAAALWTALEWLRSRTTCGYSWGWLGYSQWRLLPLAQIAEFTGVYGVSFLMALTSAVLAEALARDATRATRGWGMGGCASLVAVCIVWGTWRMKTQYATRHTQEPPQTFPVLLIQANVPNESRASPQAAAQAAWRKLLLHGRLAAEACAAERPRLIFYPETASLFSWSGTQNVQKEVSQAARACESSLILGSFDADRKGRIYNVAVSLSRSGEPLGIYRKAHLVPFGEGSPFPGVPLLRDIAFGAHNLTAGDNAAPLKTDAGRVGVVICFESMFPDLCRAMTRRGAQLLAVITNDNWLEGTSAPADHAAMSVFRAIENRRWVAHAANTGISCFIDERGRVVARLPYGQQRTLTARVRSSKRETFYVRYGDVFVYLCVTFCLVTWWRGRRLRQRGGG